MVDLTQKQKNMIMKYYDKYSINQEFLEEIETRHEKGKRVLEILDKEKLNELSEIDFGELISLLWASAIWTNQDYLIQNIIDANTISGLKNSFKDLLYGSSDFDKRFDKFNSTVKYLGPSSITEILCLFDPIQYGIWNTIARKVLSLLNFSYLPLNKYKIEGKEYLLINETLKVIAQALNDLGLKDSDLLTVDYFLYEIYMEEKQQIKKKEEPLVFEEEFDHNEVRDFIKEIGDNLGFETDTEKLVSSGARIDAIWSAKIANLGVVTYVFEVHKSGSIDSLILNLQKSLNNPTVQKIIAVSDTKQTEKIKKEVQGLPENFRNALVYWDAFDVIKTHEKLADVMQSISKLELVRSQFGE